MKKIVLSLLCVVCLSSMATLKAQDNKMWVGGAISFGSTDDGAPDRLMEWEFSPQWGMMFNENLGAGVELSIGGWKRGDADDIRWMVMPYARYYMAVTDNFKFFGDALIGFGGNTAATSETAFRVGVRPGFQYWFAPKWSMAATFGFLGYDKYEMKNPAGDVEGSENGFGLDLDMSDINFGLYFHF